MGKAGLVLPFPSCRKFNADDFFPLGALDYTLSFDEALRDAVEQEDAASREKAMTELLSRKDLKKAHPSADHLMPIYVGAGAAGEDKGTRLFTLAEGSMSWAQYRFGEVGGPFS